MKKVLVTGATGFLGHAVIQELLRNEEIEILAIGGRPEDKVNPLPEDPRLTLFLLDDLFTRDFPVVDTVVNCAFARSNDAMLLAQALDFTERLAARLTSMKAKSVLNISSQGVYKRLPAGTLSTEESPIDPVDMYSLAKYASERLFAVSGIPYVSQIRMASLMMPQRFLSFFIRKALDGEPFTLTAPNQYTALMDVSDAASGIAALTALAPEMRASIYNLGIGKQYSLLQYAESVREIGRKLGVSVAFDVSDNGTETCAGMDCSRLMADTGWAPRIFKDEMILNLFRMYGAK